MILRIITIPFKGLGNDIIFRTFAWQEQKSSKMKYSELERMVKKAGCFDTGRQMAGHPIWHSPKTNRDFKMSNHGSEEVASGTLNQILKAAGLK